MQKNNVKYLRINIWPSQVYLSFGIMHYFSKKSHPFSEKNCNFKHTLVSLMLNGITAKQHGFYYVSRLRMENPVFTSIYSLFMEWFFIHKQGLSTVSRNLYQKLKLSAPRFFKEFWQEISDGSRILSELFRNFDQKGWEI